MTTNARNGGGSPGDAERDPRLDRLYREAARDEPPARLDAAILAAAHREAGARPRPLSARLRAWRVPVSIAAMVVVSVSLVTLVREEGGDRLAQPPASVEPHAARVESAPAPKAAAPEPAKGPAPRPPAAPAARDRAPEVAGALRADDAAGRRAPEAVMMRPAESPAPAAAPAPPPAFVRDEPPAPLAAPAAGGPAAGIASVEESRRPLATPAPATRPAAKVMAKPAPSAEDRPAAAADAVGAARSQAGAPAAEQPRARVESRARPAARPPADAAYVAGQVKQLEAQPPERWLERIEALRREGRQADSDELLAEFRRRFPDHPLPAALRPAP